MKEISEQQTTDEPIERVKRRNHLQAVDALLEDAAALPDTLEAELYAYREQLMPPDGAA